MRCELRRSLIVLAVFLVPLGIILTHMGEFPFPSGSEYSDFAVSHYPNALYLQQSVLRHGEIPFWSNTILSGYPFAANPLSGLWYPPGWLAFLLPLPAGLNLMIALHLLWGGFGMYRLLTRQRVIFPAALAGAVVFLANPKIFAHLAAGHVTLLYAVAWTPWLLLAEIHQKKWILAGAILGLILLADVRWAIPAGLIWIAWKLYVNLNRLRSAGHVSILSYARQFSLSAVIPILVGLLIAAPLLLLLFEYTSLSTRADLAPADQLALSLPLSGLLGILTPDFSAYAEWMTYFGAFPLLLMVYALAVPAVRKRALFWIGVLVVSILISLGSAIPGLDRIWQMPGFSLLRVPTRMLFLGSLAVAFLTAFSLEDLLARRPLTKPDPVFWMTPLAAFAWLLTLGLFVLSGELSMEFLWSAIALTTAVLLIVVRQRTTISNPIWAGLVVVVLLVDLVGVDALNVRFEPPEKVLSNGASEVAAFQTGDGSFRVYSPSYSLPQQTAASLNIELADGVDPLQLAAYASFFDLASGIERTEYSVTLPPNPLESIEENPGRANPDPDRLGLLNVRYLISDYPLKSESLTLLRDDGPFVYENQRVRPRAWVQAKASLANFQASSEPVITLQTPNRIEVSADGPGQLVLSEVMYPGWRAWVDGQEVDIEPVEGLLRAVPLSAGRHQVLFEFSPRGMTAGILFSVIGWLLVILVSVVQARGVRLRKGRIFSDANQ